jgi:hypothetical protein
MTHRSVTHMLHMLVSHEGMTPKLCHECMKERSNGESQVTQTRPGDSYAKCGTSETRNKQRESCVHASVMSVITSMTGGTQGA